MEPKDDPIPEGADDLASERVEDEDVVIEDDDDTAEDEDLGEE